MNIGNRQLKDFLSNAKKEFKVNTCFLCGKPINGTCNSHSIPQFVLKELHQNSDLCSASSFLDPTKGELSKKGINNCGTFHLICHECDQNYFKDYENEKTLDGLPVLIHTNLGCKILAEIMLKSVLLEYYKKCEDSFVRDEMNSISTHSNEVSNDSNYIDINEYKNQVLRLKSIISSNIGDQFHISCCKILDHSSQIAGQPLIAIDRDIHGNEINDLFNKNPLYKIIDTQFVIFPFNNKTLVLVFCLTDNYLRLKPYLDFLEGLKGNKQLRYIQATVFTYSEEIYVKKGTLKIIENDPYSFKFTTARGEARECIKDPVTGEIIDLPDPDQNSLIGFNKMKLLI